MNLQSYLPAGQVFAFFGSESKEQYLIAEESLRAQFQQTEERLLRDGSYAYGSGYQFFGQVNNLALLAGEFGDGFGGEEFIDNILVQGAAFLGTNSPLPNSTNNTGIFDKQRSGTITYEIQSGDSPSYIAASFGISTNTLLWANNLNYWSVIKPGQKLTILPVSGILHEAKKGETLSNIVAKYKGDVKKTIVYNGLPANGIIQLGQEIIIPDGKKSIYYSQPSIQFASYYSGPYSGTSHNFPWGQCTWYVAQKRYVPWNGDAKYWLGNAQRYGFQTGSEPVAGAIMATNESWYGHVAYVEAVNGDMVTVSEMYGVPYWAKGKLRSRTLNKYNRVIRGYIY